MNIENIHVSHKLIGVAVIWNKKGQILISRRLPNNFMGGLWEFPGGKVESGETVEECIQREISEELGINIEVVEQLITINHNYTNLYVSLNVYQCLYIGGIPQPLECDEVRWVNLYELDDFTFPEANTQIISLLQENGIWQKVKCKTGDG